MRKSDEPSGLVGRSHALGIVVVYVLVGALWHVSAGLLLFDLVRDSAEFARLEIFMNDLLFVALTAGLLYALIKHRMKRQLQVEAKLREERDKAQKYLDVAGVIMVVVGADQRVRLINRKGCEIIGNDEQAIVGNDWLDYFPAAGRDKVLAVFHALNRGEGGSLQYESPMLAGTGEERIISWHSSAMTDESGQRVSILSSGEDITEAKRTLEAWRRSEETARGLLNAPTDTAILTDTEGKILALNQTAAQRLRKSVDDLIGLTVYSLFSPALARERKARVDHVVQTGTLVRFEDTRDGIVFDNTIYPIFDSERNVVRLAIYGRDITEQKRAYEALRRSEEYFRALIEDALDAIGVLGIDGTIHYASPSAESVLGYQPDEMIGTNAFDYIDPEQKARLVAEFGQVMRGPAVVKNEEFLCRHKDGSWRTIQISAKRLPSEECAVINYRDITARKEMEESLRESEKRYRSLAETVTDVIWTLDLKTLRFTFVSPSVQSVLGYTVEEARIGTMDQILTPPSLALATQVLAEELAMEEEALDRSPRSRTLELEEVHKNGSTVWTEVTVTFLRRADGIPAEVLGVTRDISARRSRLEALRTSSLVDELTGLYNRRAFLTLCEQQLKMANRAKQSSAVFFVDLDNMKMINDTFGHEEGDLALKEAGDLLRESFRESDIIARIGGDEFAIMAVEVPAEEMEIPARRLQDRMEARNAATKDSYHLSVSVGAALYDPETPCTIDELLSRADKAMYEEKSAKKILGQAQFLRALKEKTPG